MLVKRTIKHYKLLKPTDRPLTETSHRGKHHKIRLNTNLIGVLQTSQGNKGRRVGYAYTEKGTNNPYRRPQLVVSVTDFYNLPTQYLT